MEFTANYTQRCRFSATIEINCLQKVGIRYRMKQKMVALEGVLE